MSDATDWQQRPAGRFLSLVSERIAAAQRDLPHLTSIGESMATSLLAGGSLFTPKLGTYWPSEFGGRAGGLMGLKPPDYVPQSENDVAFTTLPDARRWKPGDDAAWQGLVASKAKIVVNGDDAPTERALIIGGSAPDEHPTRAGLRPFDQLLRGWLTTGELIAACTRLSDGTKMPIIWMSVWLEGALVRNATFFKHDNVREPWYPPLFHDPIYVPPLEAGYVANSFLGELRKIFNIVTQQSSKLSAAGKWMAEAVAAKRKVSTVLVGHSYPQILEFAEPDQCPLAWLPSISDLQHAHRPHELGPGDVALHLGYAPVNVADVKAILARGVRFIYTSPYGRPRDLEDHPNLIWLDLPWRPADATVDVPGYSVRVLPMSSCAHSLVYFALFCELAEQMGWR